MTKNLRKRFHYCLLTPIAYTEGTVPLIYIFAAAKVQINEDITKQSYLFFLLLFWIIQELLLPLQTNNQCTFKHQYILHEDLKGKK